MTEEQPKEVQKKPIFGEKGFQLSKIPWKLVLISGVGAWLALAIGSVDPDAKEIDFLHGHLLARIVVVFAFIFLLTDISHLNIETEYKIVSAILGTAVYYVIVEV